MTVPSAPVYTYLALGDSYTIGESVLANDNFPNQVVANLIREKYDFEPARIIAKTGWTTNELQEGIEAARRNDLLLPSYNFVTLLIGVNNQYRNQSPDVYKKEFEDLLKQATRFAANKPENVVVLSIPDWGVTPFANGRNVQRIASEIDSFNAINKKLALQHRCHYIYITDLTREAGADSTLLAADGLHPSGKEYSRWAKLVSDYLITRLQTK